MRATETLTAASPDGRGVRWSPAAAIARAVPRWRRSASQSGRRGIVSPSPDRKSRLHIVPESASGPGVPAAFGQALRSLRARVLRPELVVTEIPAPVGLAPYAVALAAT